VIHVFLAADPLLARYGQLVGQHRPSGAWLRDSSAARLGVRAARHLPVHREPDAFSIAGLLWTAVSPRAASVFLTIAVLIAVTLALTAVRVPGDLPCTQRVQLSTMSRAIITDS
jgi:hypothetical protein